MKKPGNDYQTLIRRSLSRKTDRERDRWREREKVQERHTDSELGKTIERLRADRVNTRNSVSR